MNHSEVPARTWIMSTQDILPDKMVMRILRKQPAYALSRWPGPPGRIVPGGSNLRRVL